MAYREIFVRGEAKVTLRMQSRRCGPLSGEQDSVIRSLPLERLEALAEALLDCEGMADLNTWLADLVLQPQLQSVDVNPESPNLPLSVAMAWLQWRPRPLEWCKSRGL